MVVSNGKLYFAVIGIDQSKTVSEKVTKIYRMENPGCMYSEDVTPSWANPPSSANVSMGALGGYVFVGTESGEVRPVDPPSPPPSRFQMNGGVTSMTVFQNKLYAITELRNLYRDSFGGTAFNWEDLGKIMDPGNGLMSDGIPFLESFNGFLYAGFGTKSSSTPFNRIGVQVWRTEDGAVWEKVLERSSPMHVYSMKSFGGYLYAGRYEPMDVPVTWNGFYRTDGTPSNWEGVQVPRLSVGPLEVHDSKLFAGDLTREPNTSLGEALLYWSSDGKAWSEVTADPLADGNRQGISSLASWNGRLYVGTASSTGGQVFEVGESLSECPTGRPGSGPTLPGMGGGTGPAWTPERCQALGGTWTKSSLPNGEWFCKLRTTPQ